MNPTGYDKGDEEKQKVQKRPLGFAPLEVEAEGAA